MRTQEEIQAEQQNQNTDLTSAEEWTQRNTRLILEVLLDIRDILQDMHLEKLADKADFPHSTTGKVL